jgi:hypothetical protein
MALLRPNEDAARRSALPGEATFTELSGFRPSLTRKCEQRSLPNAAVSAYGERVCRRCIGNGIAKWNSAG